MNTYLISCPDKSRQIKRIINQILSKNLVQQVKRANYAKGYIKDENGKIISTNEKLIILIGCTDIKVTQKIIEGMLGEKIQIIQEFSK